MAHLTSLSGFLLLGPHFLWLPLQAQDNNFVSLCFYTERKGTIQLSLQHGFFSSMEKNLLIIQKTFFPFHNLLLVTLCTFSGLFSNSGKPLSGFFQNTLRLLVQWLILNLPLIDETHQSVCHPHPLIGVHYTFYVLLVSSVICVESTKKCQYFF